MRSERIRQARLTAGLTLEQVAQRLTASGQPITRAGLSKYELGKSAPAAAFLLKLARVLDVKPTYFLEEPEVHVEWLAFRKHAALTQTRQEQIKAFATTVAERQYALQADLYLDEFPELIHVRTASEPADAEAAAEELRAAWHLGEAPIESVMQLVEDHGGIVVAWGKEDNHFDGLSGRVNGRVPLVVINVRVPRDRCRYNLAHELGHMVLHSEGLAAQVEERLAHRFAAAFLVPAAVARRELGVRRRHLSADELMLLKCKHGMSMQAWVHRAHDLGIIDDAHYAFWWREFNRRGWRKEEPCPLEGAEEPLRLRQLTLHALAEGIISEERAREICPECIQREPAPRPAGRQYTATELMKLPREERDRILAEAAKAAEEEYRTNPELSEFEAFGEDDLYDDYPE